MVVFDAVILSLVIDERSRIPDDFRTGQPIADARARALSLIASLESENESVVIPAPALAEALVSVSDRAIEITERMESMSAFRIKPFGKREAVELALQSARAIRSGDKRDGVDQPWQKCKYDRQIVATAKTEGAAIYSADRQVHEHAKLWGVLALHLGDVPLRSPSGEQTSILPRENDVSDSE